MRRKDRETSEDMAWAIFDKANHAVISVVDQAGKPYSVPMLVARKERSVYYHSFFRGHMYEIMETSPDVCITSISIASVVHRYVISFLPYVDHVLALMALYGDSMADVNRMDAILTTL